MENLDQPLVLMKAVVNPNRGMKDFTNIRASRNWRSDPRKILQKLNMLNERHAKRFRGSFVISADIVENVL